MMRAAMCASVLLGVAQAVPSVVRTRARARAYTASPSRRASVTQSFSSARYTGVGGRPPLAGVAAAQVDDRQRAATAGGPGVCDHVYPPGVRDPR